MKIIENHKIMKIMKIMKIYTYMNIKHVNIYIIIYIKKNNCWEAMGGIRS